MYLLRWRLDWLHGKKKYGHWGREAHPNDFDNLAWRHSKRQLSRAFIERKNIVTKEISIAAEIEGVDFCMFQWMGRLKFKGPGQYVPTIIGLQLVCRDQCICVMNDGEIHTLPKLSTPEKHFHFGK